MGRTLHGKTLVLTRPEPEATAWAERLRALGARVVLLPCVAVEAITDPGLSRALARALGDADWLAFTSPRAVTVTRELLPAALPRKLRLAAVGPTTAAAVRTHFGPADLVGPGGGEALARALLRASFSPPRTVVVPSSDRARRDLEAVLSPAGVVVRRFTVYRTRPAPADPDPVDLGRLGVDAVLVASPSAVAGLRRRARLPEELPLVALGPTTARAARAAGFARVRAAPRPTLEAMLEVLP